MSPSLGSSSKFEPDFRLEVKKAKARARLSFFFILAKLWVKSYDFLAFLALNCWTRQGSIVDSAKLDQVRAWISKLDQIRFDPAVIDQ